MKCNIRNLGLAAGAVLAGLASSGNAATLAWSTTAPTVDGADIASFSGAASDAGNIAAGNDAGTYSAENRPAQGQTFTTGGNLGGYSLQAITLQHVTYGPTSWSLDTGWNPFNGRFEVSVGTITAGIFTSIATEIAAMNASAPANQNNGTGTGRFLTLNLATAVSLSANTQYAFTVFSQANQFGGPFLELNGIGTTSGSYTGGEALSLSGTGGSRSNVVTARTGDRVFHLDMTAVPEPSAALLGGLGMLGLLRRRRM